MKIHLVITLLFFMAIVGCSKPTEVTETDVVLRHVRTLTLESPEQKRFIELPGVVAANRKAELSFRIAGKIKTLAVKEGDHVVEGQVLASLDSTDVKIQLKSDQAEFDRALADFNRGQALVSKGTISQADYNQLQSTLAAAEAALETTKQNLLYGQLKAPFDGVIAKRNIDNFEEVQAKQEVLTLQDVSSIDIKVDIPERIMILTNEDTKPEVEALFDAIPDTSFPLALKEVATQADLDTNTYEVTLSMPRVDGFNILPGMSVTTRARQTLGLPQLTSTSVYVPAHAVLEDSSGRYAFVVIQKDEAVHAVERRDLTTGTLSSLGLEITSGLAPGDTLIIAGMSKMYQGLEVLLLQDSRS